MTRNLKVLGLALAAMLTMGIAVASASAAEFHTETAPTTLTGTQTTTNTFVTDSGTIHCKSAAFEGTVSTVTTTTVVVTPEYKECQSTGFIEAGVTVDHNGCKYSITSHGVVTVTGCTNANKSIVVTAPFCTIEITEATNKALSPVTFKNVGAGTTREIEVVSAINNISYHESGFACKNNGAKNTTGGTYSGTVKVTGENPVTKAHHGIFWL